MTRTLLITLHNVFLVRILLMAALLAGAYALFVPASLAQAKPCGVYSVAYNVPAGYGAAYNVHSLTREVLLQSMCDTAGFSATISSSATSPTNFAVFTTGYRWDGSKWVSFTMAPNGGSTSGSYVMGNAKSSATLAYAGENTYWVSFACVLNGGKWKCGCRDAYCQKSYWNLQVAYNPPPPTVPGGGGSGTLGEISCTLDTYPITESGKRTTVNSADGLKSAMASAQGGDVIVLGAGNYSWVDIKDKSYSSYVKIQGSPGATLKHLGFWNMKNVQVDGVNFLYGDATGETGWAPKIIEVHKSENIRIVNNTIVGNPNTKTYKDVPGEAARFLDVKNTVFANNKVSKVDRGVLLMVADGYVVKHNIFTDLGCDGIYGTQSHNGVIESNYINRMHPFIYAAQGSTCHSDFVQFDAGSGRQTAPPDSNIVVRGNVFLQGENASSCSGIGSECGAIQGIFFGGDSGDNGWYKNITITDNVYCASGIQGIAVKGVNILVKNNAHYSCPAPFGSTHTSNLNLGKGVTAQNNVTGRVSGQEEAIAKAKQFSWLNNCVLKGL